MAVHQLIPNFNAGDASGQAALHLQLLLRRAGIFGEIYAGEIGEEVRSLARPASALHPPADDLVLYHHGIASTLASRMLHLPCRRGIVFHNVSPRRFYRHTPLESALVTARAQLAALAGHVDVAIGVSEYNAAELREAGFTNVHVVPLFVEPERFALKAADVDFLGRLRGDSPTLVTVSRVVPHKRMQDAVSLMGELRRIRPSARLLIVGGYDAGSLAFKTLAKEAKRVGGIEFLGPVSHAELVAAYRAADLFVSMSEHEGFGVPLIEAMAADVPVLAYAAAAVPETLGGAGVAFTEKRFAYLAELADELTANTALREQVLAGQRRRLGELSAAQAGRALQVALSSLPQGSSQAVPARAKRRKKPRVGFVVQRFGEVGGGAEKHAKDVATRLTADWDVRVLTTCAKDHLTWANEFAPGRDEVDGLEVERFPVLQPREIHAFNRLSKKVFDRPLERAKEEHWVADQGPLAPGLLRHLAEARDYDGFVFFTYLYAPTVWGVPLVSDRALLVPTAHDEPPIRFGVYRDAFELPRALLCNTPEEVSLIDRLFPSHARARVVGVGVDAQRGLPDRFALRHGIRGKYLLYVGRLEAGKGLPELLAFYRALVRGYEDAPMLLLAGSGDYHEPGERVRYLGRISEQDKEDGIAGALGVVVPSRYESLSLLTLEAFAQGTPVLVNGASDVLAGQVSRSGAGLTYSDSRSFVEGVRALGHQRAQWSRKGLAYARRFTWERVLDVYREEMARIIHPGLLKEPRR